VQDRVVLDVRGLSSRWHHDVSLQVRAGEVVGLAGLTGAGRTELAKVVFGDLPATSGEIRIDRELLKAHEPADVMEAGVAFAPEDRKGEALLLSRSVSENITLASLRRTRRGPFVDGRAERRIAQRYVDALGIVTPSLQQEIARLSGGNQQKAVLARWLAREPRLLILDEPTRGIDIGAKTDIYRLIDEMASAGVAVLLISSELPEILGLADRIVVMRQGRIAGALDHDQASEEAILRLAMPQEALSPPTAERHV
jgi:ABC-type sugar transport system ATPase subunit